MWGMRLAQAMRHQFHLPTILFPAHEAPKACMIQYGHKRVLLRISVSGEGAVSSLGHDVTDPFWLTSVCSFATASWYQSQLSTGVFDSLAQVPQSSLCFLLDCHAWTCLTFESISKNRRALTETHACAVSGLFASQSLSDLAGLPCVTCAQGHCAASS